MAADPSWDFRDPRAKERVLAVMRTEMDAMLGLVSEPAHWNASTACTGWEVRDMVGHLVDAIESYLAGFDAARGRGQPPQPVGVERMAAATDEAARAFRDVPRDVLLARFRDACDRVMSEFDALTAEEWSSLLVADKYLGPLPAMIVAAGLLGGLAVHGWDVREGLGARHTVDGDAADLLVPFVFLFWGATADTSQVEAPFAVGVRVSGRNGGDTRVDVTAAGLRFTPGDLDGCAAVLEFDPATLLLTAYARTNAGTVRGDRDTATTFLSRFRSI